MMIGRTRSYSVSPISSESPRGNCSEHAEHTEFSAIKEEQCYRRCTESARQDAKESYSVARLATRLGLANCAAKCNADDLRLHRCNAGVAAGLISQIMDAHMIETVWRQEDCTAAEQIGAPEICS